MTSRLPAVETHEKALQFAGSVFTRGGVNITNVSPATFSNR